MNGEHVFLLLVVVTTVSCLTNNPPLRAKRQALVEGEPEYTPYDTDALRRMGMFRARIGKKWMGSGAYGRKRGPSLRFGKRDPMFRFARDPGMAFGKRSPFQVDDAPYDY